MPELCEIERPAPTAWNERPDAVIDRRERLPVAEFRREYLRPLKPVVLAGALYRYPAMGKWTPDFFREHYPDKPVNASRHEYSFGEHLDAVEASTPENPAPYLFNFLLDEQFPELIPDVSPWPGYMLPNWLERPCVPGNLGRQLREDTRAGLFIGGLGSGAPKLHADFGYHSFSFQFFGRKKFYFYPADQSPLMYPMAESRCLSEVPSVERPDFDRFPLFRDSEPLTCVVEPGDLLFIPGGWWHTTRLLSVSISLSVNTADAACWRLTLRERYDRMKPSHPRLAGPAVAAMRMLGWARAGVDRLAGRF